MSENGAHGNGARPRGGHGNGARPRGGHDNGARPRGGHDNGARPRGLLMDWGGVMTHNLLGSFATFCEAEGLDPQALAGAFRGDERARELLFGFEEGRVAEEEFEDYLGQLLGLRSGRGFVQRIFGEIAIEESMVTAVRAAKAAGVRTGLVSNSWGTTRYPRELLNELFEGIVISGEVGVRKPTPRIYELGAESIALPPEACVFVDDLPFNLPPAVELGMSTVHHTAPERTIAELERLLEVDLPS